MKKNYISTSLVLATLSAMSAIAHSEELKKQSNNLNISEKSKIQGLENLENKEYFNISALKNKWNITDRIYQAELENIFNKKIISLSIGQNINTIVENYGEDKVAKAEIFENIILAQTVYGSGSNQDSTQNNSALVTQMLGGSPAVNANAINNFMATGSSCHFACHGACHSACHGSRGWR